LGERAQVRAKAVASGRRSGHRDAVDLVVLLPAFVLAVVLISASPGPAMALILRRAATDGWRAAVPTILGLEVGLYVWALVAAAGFAALVAASETAFVVLRVVGAAVLIHLGAKAWLGLWRERHETGHPGLAATPSVAGPPRPRRVAGLRFTEGLLVQLANPKAAVFMIAFYPQFVPASRPLFATTAALALLQVLIETALYLLLAVGVGRAGRWLTRPRVRRRIEATSGAVLIGLGVRVAVSER
jgi:threonine/homoserine/homoserine lactone efflux protein